MQVGYFYESADGQRMVGFTTTVNPESIPLKDMEMTTKARLRWQMDNSLLDARSTVTSEFLFGGCKTIVVKAQDPSGRAKFCCYIIRIQELPREFHGLWIIQSGNISDQQDEKWIADFLGSVTIVSEPSR
jgi:hypothetical protein